MVILCDIFILEKRRKRKHLTMSKYKHHFLRVDNCKYCRSEPHIAVRDGKILIYCVWCKDTNTPNNVEIDFEFSAVGCLLDYAISKWCSKQ